MMNIEFNIREKPLDPDLFDGIAKKIADRLGHSVDNGNYKKTYGVGRTQIRRLYDEVKRFEQKLDGTDETWKEHYPFFRMIKSKLSYTIARAKEKAKDSDTANGYKNLSEFITKGINQVENEENYRVFAALFEAVYGFYYENAPKEN
ncbi:MAG: type III-A CRISPR-associated protein Csm2 [Treponema sp.]|jgi:CRISPR-associated protein Csm2|nr:type III-A CRISPR-associated protein Csm2 [Treponema sp.]